MSGRLADRRRPADRARRHRDRRVRIAAASARLFAAEGARVAIVSRTEERCRALVEARSNPTGGTASYAVADLADEAQAAGAMDAAIARSDASTAS